MLRAIKSFIHMLSLDQKSCEEYCRQRRLLRFEKYGGRIRFLALHTLAHRILVPIFKLYIAGEKKKLIIVKDSRKKTDKPKIFCPTHIGGMDVEMSFIAIKEPCIFLLGDPRELYRTMDGFMLQLSGVIPVDVDSKEDRAAAKATMVDVLRKGGNLFLFPEGVQNISPNALLGKLFPGAVELAITCGAEIVPIAIHKDKGTYYVSIGENISYEGYSVEDKIKLTRELRDHMATLKWKIIESLPMIDHSDVTQKVYEEMINDIFNMNTEYTWTMEDIKKGMYREEGVTPPEEAFTFMDKLVPSKDNAFLYNKTSVPYFEA